ncbi:MAG: SDR family oxidoreductase [bacterium]|nr:SDR family oxidoreductase [bacterium]
MIGSALSLSHHGHQLRNDYEAFAAAHAGVSGSHGKEFYIDVANWISVFDYNEQRMADRSFGAVYDTETEYWMWDSEGNRARMDEMRLTSDRSLNRVIYAVALIGVNHEAREVIRTFRPTTIVHAAALSKVLECEQHPVSAHDQNVAVTETLLRVAEEIKSHFVYISTDQVFSGVDGNYTEIDLPTPTHVYGKTKYAAEQLVTQANSDYLIARSNNIVGRNVGWGTSFTDGLLEKWLRNQSVDLFTDQIRSPIHLRAITDGLCNCIYQRVSGILHLGGPEKLSRYDTARKLAAAYGLPLDLIKSASMSSHPQAHTLHKDGTFDTIKFQSLFPEQGYFTILDGFRLDRGFALQPS